MMKVDFSNFNAAVELANPFTKQPSLPTSDKTNSGHFGLRQALLLTMKRNVVLNLYDEIPGFFFDVVIRQNPGQDGGTHSKEICEGAKRVSRS